MGRPRYVVRYWAAEPGVGRVKRLEVLGGEPPQAKDTLGGVLAFREQERGDMHIISRALVKDVAVEQSDRYGTWHRVGTWEPGKEPPQDGRG